jgi:hypothetical protein
VKHVRTTRYDRRNHVIVAPEDKPIEKVTRFIEAGGMYDALRGPARKVPMSLARVKWAEGERT